MDDGILPRSITAVTSALTKGFERIQIDPSQITGRLLLILFLILVAGFFAGAETALAACNKLRIKQLAENGNRRAKTACRIIDRYDRAVVVILIATNIAHALSASVGAILFIDLLGDIGSLISTILITLTVFIFADTIPKNIAHARCDSFMLNSAIPLYFVMKISLPVSAIFTFLSDRLKKRLSKNRNKEPIYTDDELTDIVETVEEEGIIEHEESSIIRSAIEFGDLCARDILTPCDRVFALPVRLDRKQMIEKLLSVKYSRVPLYRDDPGSFIGFLRAEEYLVSAINGKEGELRRFISPPMYISGDTPLASVFEDMGKKRTHLAFVRDSEKKTLGIITMEDLLESIVGEIIDSDDSAAPESNGKEGARQ